VSGLAPSTTTSDVQQFKSLCAVEFNVSPDVTATKRLGRPLQGKIQPLLIVLQQESQAQQLIAKARELRQSQNDTVRSMIYINPNLTRAEAEAAYRMRVERREAGKRRTVHSAQHPGQQRRSAQQRRNESSNRDQSSADRDRQTDNHEAPTSDPASSSGLPSLNPMANAFTPLASEQQRASD
jgi:hypothetical protein